MSTPVMVAVHATVRGPHAYGADGLMDSGCSSVGYGMDRMDEAWNKRGAAETPAERLYQRVAVPVPA